MLVTVILASYNHVKYIKKSILSVLNQTYKNIELIVLDDGSTDGTPEVVEKIKDSRLKLVRLIPNRRYHPRNVGINLAKGSYIAFQNSDDVWVEDKLQKQVDYMEKNRGTSLCFTRLEIIDEKDNIVNNSWAHGNLAKENKNNIDWLKYLFVNGVNFGIASAVVRTKQIKKLGGFNESMVQMSDYDLWVRLLGLGELFILDDKLTKMRILKNINLSTPKNEVYWRSALENVNILNRYIEWPVKNSINKIFSELFNEDINSLSLRLASIVKYAWSINTPQHILFADQLMVKILSDKIMSEEVLSYFGADFKKEYLTRRGKFEMIVHNLNE